MFDIGLKTCSQRRFGRTIILLVYQFGCYSFAMNKNSATKKRPAKASRNRGVRKASARKPARRTASARKPAPSNGRPIAAIGVAQLLSKHNGAAAPTPLSTLRTHRFSVGQTVSYTSSPITRPGASGSYKVVRLLPSDGDDYQYRIKNPGEAFERVAKESQLELEL